MESVKTKKIRIFTTMIPEIWAQVLEQEVKSLKKAQNIFSSMKSFVKDVTHMTEILLIRP